MADRLNSSLDYSTLYSREKRTEEKKRQGKKGKEKKRKEYSTHSILLVYCPSMYCLD